MQKLQAFTEAGNTTLTIAGAAGTIAQKVQGSFPLCTVTVYTASTLTIASIYSDNGITPKANPFTSSADGTWFFYAADGRYDVRFSGTGITTPFTLGDFSLLETTQVSGVFINPKGSPYNAKGDGVTDDTAALQAALDAGDQGGRVVLPGGIYIISSPLLIPESVTFEGVSPTNVTVYGAYASTIMLKSDTTVTCMARPERIDGSEFAFQLKSLAFNANAGDGGVVTGAVLDLQAVYNLTKLEDIQVWNYNAPYGIRIGPGTAVAGQGSGAVYAENIWLLGNSAYTCGGVLVTDTYGANTQPEQGIYFNTLIIEGCINADSIRIQSATNSYNKEGAFNNVMIEQHAGGTSGYPIHLLGAYNYMFTNLRIFTDRPYGIYLPNAAPATQLNLGNKFINVATYGPGGMTAMIKDDLTGFTSGQYCDIYFQNNNGNQISELPGPIKLVTDVAANIIKFSRSDMTQPRNLAWDAVYTLTWPGRFIYRPGLAATDAQLMIRKQDEIGGGDANALGLHATNYANDDWKDLYINGFRTFLNYDTAGNGSIGQPSTYPALVSPAYAWTIYNGDVGVILAGSGIVLTNAAGTVTKRVRLNDAGNGLIYDTP